jgi:hypothetical protein
MSLQGRTTLSLGYDKAKTAILRYMSASVIALMATVVCAKSSTSPSSTHDGVPSESVDQRSLNLPVVPVGQRCPVSVGTRGTVPSQRHIFWNPLWFGDGPVYFSLTWKESTDDAAAFSLARVPFEDGAYRAKTPWVSVPSHSGPIVIRGRALSADSRPLMFRVESVGPQDSVTIQAPHAPSASLWSFWASSMWVPGPGCYGIQIDTSSRTEIVIFEAT